MDATQVTGTNLGYVWAISSGILFTVINSWVLEYLIPKSAAQTAPQKWKWKNTANSLLHSIISGAWSCLCFWQTPEMRQDLISKYTASAHGVISFSTGYFAYDLVDMLLHHRKRSSYELMIHHIFVLLCFGLSVTTRFYVGYGLVALLVEVNSVFLHTRQLMLIQGINKRDSIYRLNSTLNLVTFIVFRIMTLGWMTRWLVLHRDELTLTAFSLGSISMAVIMLMNIILFLRVLNADYRQRPARQAILHEEPADCKGHTKVKS